MPIYYTNGTNQVSGEPANSWFTVETAGGATHIMDVHINTSTPGATDDDKAQSVYERCVIVADNYSTLIPPDPTPVDIPPGWMPS